MNILLKLHFIFDPPSVKLHPSCKKNMLRMTKCVTYISDFTPSFSQYTVICILMPYFAIRALQHRM